MTSTSKILALITALILPLPTWAEAPEIIGVQAQNRSGGWTFSVTLRHPDTGWDHYADGWEVLDPDGNRLGFRELAHPHVNEQPFTRSLSGVAIPGDLDNVLIRARDNIDGWADDTFSLKLNN